MRLGAYSELSLCYN